MTRIFFLNIIFKKEVSAFLLALICVIKRDLKK